MKVIYKHVLEPGLTELTLRGPILSVGTQGEDVVAWSLHDPEAPERDVWVAAVGTGMPVDDDAPDGFNAGGVDECCLDPKYFVQTVFLGLLVFHIFSAEGLPIPEGRR